MGACCCQKVRWLFLNFWLLPMSVVRCKTIGSDALICSAGVSDPTNHKYFLFSEVKEMAFPFTQAGADAATDL